MLLPLAALRLGAFLKVVFVSLMPGSASAGSDAGFAPMNGTAPSALTPVAAGEQRRVREQRNQGVRGKPQSKTTMSATLETAVKPDPVTEAAPAAAKPVSKANKKAGKGAPTAATPAGTDLSPADARKPVQKTDAAAKAEATATVKLAAAVPKKSGKKAPKSAAAPAVATEAPVLTAEPAAGIVVEASRSSGRKAVKKVDADTTPATAPAAERASVPKVATTPEAESVAATEVGGKGKGSKKKNAAKSQASTEASAAATGEKWENW